MKDECIDWVDNLRAQHIGAVEVDWERSKNSASHTYNTNMLLHLRVTSTSSAWNLKRSVDIYIGTLNSTTRIYTVVQPQPWKAPYLPTGGRAFGMLKRQGLDTVTADYFRSSTFIKLHKAILNGKPSCIAMYTTV